MAEGSNPAPIDLERTWLIAGALVAILAVLGAVFELGATRLVTEGPLMIESDEAQEDEELVQITPGFDIEGPTTLDVILTREPADGSLLLDCALVEQQTGEVRELSLASQWMGRTATGARGDLRASARVDRVATGSYVMRFTPSWDPVVEPTPGRADSERASAPHATVRIEEGGRSPVAFFAALSLLLVPALVQTARAIARRRR